LSYGTQKENIADKKEQGTYRKGHESHRSRLTAEQVAEIRADKRYRWKPLEYAAKFEVSKGCVVDARVGKTY
jgi:hypothetical protein